MGGATKKRRPGNKNGNNKKNTLKTQANPIKHRHSRQQLSETIIPVLISAVSAAHTFLLHDSNHHNLLPSQTLTLEQLLSSTSRSLSRLLSLLSLPIIPPPYNAPNPHHQNWFLNSLSDSPDHDPRWVHFFNLSKPSFTLLLRLLTPSLTSLSSSLLPPNAALAATLFRLSHAASYASVGRRFSVDSPTACRAFYVVCKAIVDNLGHLFELGSDINRVIVGFGWMSLPNCCGVLGVERFELESVGSSLLVQGLVDSEGRFLDVSAGWPGCERPGDVLRRCKLFLGVEDRKEYLNGPPFELSGGGGSVPQYVLGGSCHPLLPWLLTPFSEEKGRDRGEEGFNCSEVAFNGFHSRGMDLVRKAFAKVKKRWKLVGRKWKEECVGAFPFVIVACCLLHNFLIKCSEVLQQEEEDAYSSCCDRDAADFAVFDGEEDESGKRVRDALASYLSLVNQRS